MSAASLSELFNNASKDVAEACDFVAMVAESVVNDVQEFGIGMGRAVKTLTDQTLPKPLATVVQKAFNSLPFFLAAQILPVYITVPAMLGFALVNSIDKNPFSNQVNANIYNGLAFSRGYRMLHNVTSFVVTGNIHYLAAGAISAVLGALFYIKGRQYEG